MQAILQIIDWLKHNPALTALVLVAWAVVLVVSMWSGHRFLISIPADYFIRQHKPLEAWRSSHPVLRWTILITKNLAGLLLILAGFVMLFTPGQGVLTLLLGISLADIPGKRAVERRIIRQASVLSLVNRLRERANQPPLEFAAPANVRN